MSHFLKPSRRIFSVCSREIDDGVKAAATSSMLSMKGIEGKYRKFFGLFKESSGLFVRTTAWQRFLMFVDVCVCLFKAEK